MAIKPVTKNNPSFLTEGELVRFFIDHSSDLSTILETVKENTTLSNQHILLIGPRGIGKTMLILRIVAAINNDEKLASNWYPLVFGEESYEVSTAGQFWLQSLFHLGEQTNDQYWLDIYRNLLNSEGEKELCDRALSSLMEFADKQGKRILLMVENLDLLFGEQIGSTDMWTIRHTLENESRLMLLGTATAGFNKIDKSGEPLFEFFRIHELEPLNVENCQAFWKAVTGQSIEYERMRPVQILTGGNPRLLAIIASYIKGDTLPELMRGLNYLIDEYTNYFKSATESLPSTERKVFVILAGIWEPATASQVAAEARISVNESSALLNRLVSRGAVVPVKVKGRKKSYQVAERLYNIYYLIRRSHRPSDRIQALVRFMIHFYGGEKLALKMPSPTIEARKFDIEARQDYFSVYKKILSTVGNEKDIHPIAKSTPHELSSLPDFDIDIFQIVYQPKYPVEVDTKLYDRDVKSEGTSQEKSPGGEPKKTPDESRSGAHMGQLLYEKLEPHVGAEEAYHRVAKMNPDTDWPWVQLGRLLHEKLKRYEEAGEAYRKAIEINPKSDWAWAHLGQLLHERLESYEEAGQAYRKALEIDPKYDWAWAHLGQLLHEKLDRYEEAEEAYGKVVEINPRSDWAWAHLGQLLHEKLESYEEAGQAYRKALEIDPKYDWAWAHLGQMLHEKLDRFEEAEEAYRRAIEFNNKPDWAWAHLGQLLYEKMEHYEEAEKAYYNVAKFNPRSDWPWVHLGQLLCEKLDRYEEAEKAYLEVIRNNPGSDWAWAHLGQLLHEKLDRHEEAEGAYRKAVEAKPEYDWAWAHLGQLLHEKLERYEEAGEAYGKAVDVSPEYYWAWAHLGRLLHEKLDRYEEAEKAYRKAIELNPGSDWAWAHLGQLLHEKLDRYKEAEEAYGKAVEIYPEYDWAWAHLGQLLHEKLDRYAEAEEAYSKVVQINIRSDWAWAHLGQLLHEKLDRYAEAERAYRRAVEIDTKYDWAWVKMGQLLQGELGRYEEAEEVYRKAVDIDPEYNWPWINLGLVLHTRLNRFIEAEEAYRRAAEIDPNQSLTWIALGVLLYYELERLEEAEESFLNALQAEPNNTSALEMLIRVKIGLSAPHELIFETIDRYMEVEGRTDSSLDHMARLIYETGFRAGFPYAERLVKEALEMTPGSPHFQHTLASIIGSQGRWMEALDIAPGFLASSILAENSPNDLVLFFSEAAITGFARECLNILKDSPSAPIVEPLIVALQMLTEEEYNAPKEVVEIAMDIVHEIERKQAAEGLS